MANVGLVLEGGGMRGTFTAGVLDFWMDRELWLDDIYAVSAGTCQGCSYLSRQKGRGLRVWVNYMNDKRFCSIESLVRTGDLFGVEMSYNLVPNQYDPFDYDEFLKRTGRFIAVVTNVETGEAEYLHVADMRKDMQMLRASSSLPLVSKIVEFDGKKYLDGGVADSIPLKASIEDGHAKNVVVLTQGADYRKQPNRAQKMIRMKYGKYPNFVNAMLERHVKYNESLDFIEAEERAGRAFVVRPDAKLDVGRIEKDVEKLKAVHRVGYDIAQREHERLMAFLKDA